MPWLNLAGRRVDDYCRVRIDESLDLHPATIGVECHRTVTAVYGADGPLTARLADLGTFLGSAGWGDFFSYGAIHFVPEGTLEVQHPPVSGLWQQAPLPAGTEAVPPAGVHLARLVQVGWTSRGQPPDPRWTLDGTWRPAGPVPPETASRYWHPVETDDADISVLAARALAGHEHAIAIGIPICYYFNPDVRRSPIRRSLFPVRPASRLGHPPGPASPPRANQEPVPAAGVREGPLCPQ
jgi:hypothetical protein